MAGARNLALNVPKYTQAFAFLGVDTYLIFVEHCANMPKCTRICFDVVLVNTLHMSNLWKPLSSKCYTQWTASVHMFKVLRNGLITYVQTCDNVRAQFATQWTASVHTLHMSKPVITSVVKVTPEILHLLSKLFWNYPNDTKKGVSNSFADQKSHKALWNVGRNAPNEETCAAICVRGTR